MSHARKEAASLTAQNSGVTYLVLYDSATGSVSLAHMTGDAVEGRDFQLWIARGNDAPVSLGVIPAVVGALLQEVVDVVVIFNALRAHGPWRAARR